MFPNVRLLVGALFASIVALSCGFGVFAAFRVNHEPLSRLPADTVALQLVTSEAVGPHPAWGAPFGTTLHASESVSAARIGGVADTPTPPPIRRATLERLSPADVQPQATIGAPAPTAPSASTAVSPVQQTSAAEAPSTQPAPDAKGDVPGTTGEPAIATVPAVAAIEAPPSPAPAPPAEITSAPEAAAPATTISPKLDSPQPQPRKAIRKPVERRRIAERRHIIRRTRPRAVAQSGKQNSDFNNPVFQSAPDAFQRQSATNRRSAKRTSENTPSNNAGGGSFDWLTPR